MPNLKLTLEYDGSQFYGWQCQPNLRTVQGEVERAIGILFCEKIRVNAAGRTDAGVHAFGQVINFKTSQTLNLETLPRSLNGILSRDVVIKDVKIVPEDFHARFDAISRQYVYVLSRQPVAVGRRFHYFAKFPLNLAAIRLASKYLIGKHSFRAFCPRNTDDPHFLSCIEFIRWKEIGDKVFMRVRANRFLRNMVRIIVGTMIDVGRGFLKPEDVLDILNSGQRAKAGFTAPPQGLFFEKVRYLL